MISSNWDDYQDYGNASTPTNNVPEAEAPMQKAESAISWDDLPDYGNAESPTNDIHFEAPGLVPNVKGMAQLGKAAWETIPGHKYLSGALSSILPEVQEEPGYEAHKTAGQVIGTGASIAAIASPIGQMVSATLGSLPVAPYITSGLTGAVYKILDTAQKEGRMPSDDEIRKEVAVFTAFEGGAQLAGRVFNYVRGRLRGTPPPVPGATDLANELIGQEGGSAFEAGENALQTLQGQQVQHATVNAPQPAPPGTTDQSALFRQMRQRTRPESLRGRVTPQQASEIGIRPPAQARHGNLEERVLNTFQHESYNPTRTGTAAREQLIQGSDAMRQNVNAAYAEAEALNSSFAETREDVVNSFLDRIAEIDRVASPSTVQRSMRREMQRIVNRYTVRDPEGNITEYLPIANQDVLNQGKALRSRVETDFMHGTASNQFLPLIDDLNVSARAAAEAANAPEAVAALDAANQQFRQWNQLYNNDLIAGIRNPSNITPNKIFKDLLNPDNFAAVRPLLEQTPQGRVIVESLQRKIADKSLKKFYDNPRANVRERQEIMRELEDILTPEQLQGINNAFNAPEPRFVGNATPIGRQQQAEEVARRTMGLERPEQVNKLMNERSGIRELRRDLPENQFRELSREKTRDIVLGGHYEGTPTATELLNRLTKIKNRELLIEMHGQQAYDEILTTTRQLATEEAAAEAAEVTDAARKRVWRDRYKKLKAGAKVLSFIGIL